MPQTPSHDALRYDAHLARANPALRKALGAWYTPRPVAQFIVRACSDLLRTEFAIPDGITASQHPLRILDPATGTGLFLAETIRHIREAWPEPPTWQEYARHTLAPRLHGIELMPEPLTLAKESLTAELACGEAPPLNLRNANALAGDGLLPASSHDGPLLILGNPPYNNGNTPENSNPWILNLLAPYKEEPNERHERLRERKLNLNDDYVKFIRLGQLLLEANGTGIMALITPHGFLSNPTFRGMRWQLLRAFNRIYTVDLHGNHRRGETASGDQNLFPIQQGVAITLFLSNGKEHELGQLLHHEVQGKRTEKEAWLEANSIASIPWQTLRPASPYYLFVPQTSTHTAEYQRGFAIEQLMPLHGIGIGSSQNQLLIHKTPGSLRNAIGSLISLPEADLRAQYPIRESPNWSLALAREDVGPTIDPQRVQPIAYQPFDTRFIYYGSRSRGIIARPGHRVSRHMLGGDNIALILQKQHDGPYSHCLCTHRIINRDLIGSKGYLFPLYTDGQANLHKPIYQAICNLLGEEVKPQVLFDYIYAILHCPQYRARYAEQLRIGFPRIPYPSNLETFHNLANLGAKLRVLHLMENADSWSTGVRFEGEGERMVDAPKWVDANGEGRVYINPTQYFAPIPRPVWEFRVGSYPPMQKWLKERRGEAIDTSHYRQMAHAIRETISIMAEIDGAGCHPCNGSH